MTTKETIQRYFDGINQKTGWESLIADNMAFVGAITKTSDKSGYVQATNGFLQVVQSVQITRLIAEGSHAAVIAHYNLISPKGNTSASDIAEIFEVENGKIISSRIFFDTVAFREFMALG
jgi:ketosteroid isomerase-like protein